MRFDKEAILRECNRTFQSPLGPCRYPACCCINIPLKHTLPDHEKEDDLRDQIANGGC